MGWGGASPGFLCEWGRCGERGGIWPQEGGRGGVQRLACISATGTGALRPRGNRHPKQLQAASLSQVAFAIIPTQQRKAGRPPWGSDDFCGSPHQSLPGESLLLCCHSPDEN